MILVMEGQELVERYIRYRNDLAPSTHVVARESIAVFLRWLGPRVLTQEELQRFINWYKVNRTPSYADKIGKHVIWFCQWMAKTGIMKVDPTEGIERPRLCKKRNRPYYSPEEYIKLRDAAGEDTKSFVIM